MNDSTQRSITVMLEKAQSALKAGDKDAAAGWAHKILKLSPENVEANLILAATSKPAESVRYLTKVLEVDPQNQKARRGMDWAIKQMKEEEAQKNRAKSSEDTQKIKLQASSPKKTIIAKEKKKETQKKTSPWGIVFFLAIIIICFGAFTWYGLPYVNFTTKEIKEPRPSGVMVKPTLTPTATPTPTATLTPTPTLTPTATSTPRPTEIQNYSSYFAHSWDIPNVVSGTDKFWIEVDLSEQMVYTYRGDTFLQSFLVSTGTSAHPTVTGTFKIYAKYESYLMVGDGYYLPDVPYAMFFYKGYSLHGTYWHSNFGTPMSHGCVNMRTSDAEWVYANAPIGTYVFVHD